MAKHKVQDIRNIAVVGHAGAGKTSLVDAVLFEAKVVDRRGSVDDGTSVADYDEQEKERRTHQRRPLRVLPAPPRAAPLDSLRPPPLADAPLPGAEELREDVLPCDRSSRSRRRLP